MGYYEVFDTLISLFGAHSRTFSFYKDNKGWFEDMTGDVRILKIN